VILLITVQQATLSELTELAQLFDQYRVFYGQTPDLEGAKAFLHERLSYMQSVVWIAKDEGGSAAGFVQLYPTFSSISMKRDWILNDLFVAERYRGQGVASRLLAAAEAHAVNTGAKGIGLSTAMNNDKAQRLYEMHRFVREEEFIAYYKKV
jgi:ribosomal protein S18 acetylase RimI-like enzyme